MRLGDFKNLHNDTIAVIACNGPSLNDIDMSLLQGKLVFALNRGYLKKDLPFTYLVTADKRVEKEFEDEILAQPCIKFCHDIGSSREDRHDVVKYSLRGGLFSTNAAQGVRLGHSVTIVALQLAFYMGCDPVAIIGMDHSISYEGTKQRRGHEHTNLGIDHNHFDPDYYGPGFWYRYQNLDAVAKSYSEAVLAFNRCGRRLFNASTKTALSEKIMPRVDLTELLL